MSGAALPPVNLVTGLPPERLFRGVRAVLAFLALGLSGSLVTAAFFVPPIPVADLFAMLIIIPAFLALGWVHKWRMG